MGADSDIPSIADWLQRSGEAPTDIAVFQNIYSEDMVDKVDPSFLPLDGRRNARTDTREFGLFLRMFHSGLYRCAPLTGVVSPKFAEKTQMTGADFLAFVRRNPGFDVYFLNPYPQIPYYTFNVWTHGEAWHSGLAALAEVLFTQAGYDPSVIQEARDDATTALFSSYWIGGSGFWEGYVTMLVRLIEAVEAMPPGLRQRYLGAAPNYPDPVPMLVFIFERSFSAYLHLNPKIRALAYPFDRDAVLGYCNPVEYELVLAFGGIVDEIDRRRRYDEADRALFTALTRLWAAIHIRNRWA